MSELLNLVGLSTGIALYAMLLVMVVSADRREPSRIDPLMLATAILGLLWNLCALPAYEFRGGGSGLLVILRVVGYSALGFLPAVVVQSVLRRERRAFAGLRRLLILVAYLVA